MVERSRGTDGMEFYQLLAYKGDVDLAKRLRQWKRFYNVPRLHGAFCGRAPHEILELKLS